MNQPTCPYLYADTMVPTKNQQVRSEIERIYTGGDSVSIVTEDVRKYAMYAVGIEEFFNTRKDTIHTAVENLYTPGKTRLWYINKIYVHLANMASAMSEEYNPVYDHISNGIGTMCLIIESFCIHSPYASRDECKNFCRKVMRDISVGQLPSIPSYYRQYAPHILDNGFPPKKDNKLVCPALYTKGGNEFFEYIIDAIYAKYPVSTTKIPT